MSAGTLYAPALWPEPYTVRTAVSTLLLPFSVISAAARQQARRRRVTTAAPAPTAIYVSKAGNDANNGLSSGAPVLTFAKAAALALANGGITTVSVLGTGTWHEEFIFPRNGLTFTAPATVTIDGDASRNGLTISSKNNCTISGAFKITNTDPAGYAISANAASGLLIDGPEVATAPRGLYVNACASPIVRHVLVHTITDRHGVEFRSCTSPTIEDSEGYLCHLRFVYNNAGTGWTVRRCYAHDGTLADPTDYGFECEFAADDGLYVDSWAGGTIAGGSPFSYGFISKTSARTRAQRCVGFGCRSSSTVGAGFYGKAAESFKIYHCDSYDNTIGVLWGFDNVSAVQTTNAELRNSIVKGNTTGLNITQSSDGTTDYDLLHGNTTPAIVRGTTYATTAALQAAGYEVHGRFTDPLYVSTVYGGFALGVGSPALAAGGDLGEGAGLNLGHTGSTYGAA